jgi:FAD/FMN-containing dehydrogenase
MLTDKQHLLAYLRVERSVCVMAFSHLTSAAQELQEGIAGSVLTPDDPGYEETRRGWNLSIDQHPALIVVAEYAQDVVATVRFAREAGLGVGIQSTGHGIQHPADNSLLIVTTRMKSVHIDATARTARAEAGAVWSQVLDSAAEHSLAPLLGTSPDVGVIGYTLGGGIGWLARRYGLAADSVRSIDIVTADGVLRHADATENSDLFWGLRGGGGNFGVVTAIEFALYPVATIYGGSLVYPGELAGDALRFFRDWTKTVPDELTSSIAIMKFPSLPQVPEALRGKAQVIVRAAFAGEAAQGDALMQPWLAWHAPTSNGLHQMPVTEIGTIQNDPINATPAFGSNEMLDALSDGAIDVIVHHMTANASPLVFSELRHAGGAITRVAADANAIGNRDAAFYLQINGLAFTPAIRAALEDYLPRYKHDLRPYLRGGVYLNFMRGDEARSRIKDAYLPAAYERLVALKGKYDPDNVFRFGYQLVA